ncbi:hypothetical protein BBJ28_00018323 [Nothophytophthora sp. Chile5]|nr:hypothetical protein BBJ28_00018323 [Nothophytophthora sp. Chile5]
MGDGTLMMMSPMDASGEERLRRARAYIHQSFGPGGNGRRAKRALAMPAAPATPAKTPRTKLRQRIEKASQLVAEDIFFDEFGSSEELQDSELDLLRPAAYPVAVSSRRVAVGDAPASSSFTTHSSFGTQQSTASTARRSFTSSAFSSTAFGAPSNASTFTSALPAPSSTYVSHFTRSTRIRTPRKTAIKRSRAGESSAEKALPLQKPRLGGFGLNSTTTTHCFGSAATSSTSSLAAGKSFAFVTTRGDQQTGAQSSASGFYSRASTSKFQFSANASRLLFSPRQPQL